MYVKKTVTYAKDDKYVEPPEVKREKTPGPTTAAQAPKTAVSRATSATKTTSIVKTTRATSQDRQTVATASVTTVTPTAGTTSVSTASVATNTNPTDDIFVPIPRYSPPNSIGRYVNWSPQHSALTAHPWCCIGDLMAFCDKYEYKTLSLTDAKAHANIVAEVKSLLGASGGGSQAPFDMRKRFPGNIHNPENLWVCIGRSPSIEYHLGRILSVFRRPLERLMTDKQRAARQDFHLAVNELRMDISARITEVRLYDRHVFEREFQLEWTDLVK